MKAMDQVKRAAMMRMMDYLLEDPEKNISKIMGMLDSVAPQDLFPAQRKAINTAIETKNNWYQLIMKLMDINPVMRNDLLKNFIVDGNLIAWPRQEEMRKEHKCNIPWAILLDPTSACNLRCTGCWAAEYGHSLNLSYDDIDSIINQGVELGVHIYIYTGGEPLVRKKDLIRLCEAHPDCSFLCFTNATLIDDEFCKEILRVKNFIPAISAEGSEETTDSRRGVGTYNKIMSAMELLRKYQLPFGISACVTSANADVVATSEYLDWMIDQGALFCWIFTYMPVGQDAAPELMITTEQREHLYHFVREMRDEKPLFMLDFQNDGEFVGGCIAGGRRYLHINAAGDVEPCVFIHYSNANIHTSTLLEALQSPIFMQYYKGQPFNENLLRPCPMLENPEKLPAMVKEAGASCTDLQYQEGPEQLCSKCMQFAKDWSEVAERLWSDPENPGYEKRRNMSCGMAETDLERFDELGRKFNNLQ